MMYGQYGLYSKLKKLSYRLMKDFVYTKHNSNIKKKHIATYQIGFLLHVLYDRSAPPRQNKNHHSIRVIFIFIFYMLEDYKECCTDEYVYCICAQV